MDKPKTDRNAEILEHRRKGGSWSAVAIHFGISQSRCKQIVRKEKQREAQNDKH